MYYPINFDNNGSSFSVTNAGTAPAPCKVTIIPKVDLVNITIMGLSDEPIEVDNVNTGQELIINGETGEVLLDEQDYFEHYNAWQFPRLLPGLNQVQISNGSQCLVQIEFNARYI